MPYKWTEKEDKILQDNYHKIKPEEIIKLLSHKRTVFALFLRAKRLHITNYERLPWTSYEDDIVRKYYPDGKWDLLKNFLPERTICATKGRAKALGLKFTNKAFRRSKKAQIDSFGRIHGSVIVILRRSAIQRKVDYQLLDGSNDSMCYLNSIANDRCALSGRLLTYAKKARDFNATASLDRIDSSKGYIKGNVQWVCKDINIAKLDMDDSLFISMCCDVAQYRGGMK